MHSVFPPFQKGGGNPNFENFKKGGEPEKKFWGGGNQKGGERFSKIKGGTQLFKQNLGIEKSKIEDFRDKLTPWSLLGHAALAH